MKNKGFTLIEMLAVMAILAILVGIATYALQGYLAKGRNKSFKLLVNTFEDGVLEAYTSCEEEPDSSSFCINHPLPDYNVPVTINLKELEDEDFIEKIKNPWKKDEECIGTTTVTRNIVEIKHKKSDGTIEILGNDPSAIDFEYKTCLKCGSHESEGCN